MSKSIKKISEGRVKDREVTWFPELVDKSEDHFHIILTCTYMYLVCFH